VASEAYKNLIIGSGEAGKSLAWHLGAAGEKTIVIERRYIGGSCPNTNCLPSKNEIWSAKVADLIHHANQFGTVAGPVSIDMQRVRQRKREMVDGLIKVHLDKYQASGAELVMGNAVFTAPRTAEVTLNAGGTRTITGERVFLNLGTRAAIPPVPGLVDAAPLTHVEMLELDRVPERLIVIGGGYVGLEFAQAYRRFGSKVTIIQRAPQLLVEQDADVVAEITRMLTDAGCTILTSTALVAVRGRSGTNVQVTLRAADGERTIDGSDLLVATGRTPNTANIGLDKIGVELDSRGYIKTNERLETTAPQTWALGEVAGTPQFTHVAYDDFRIVRDNLAGGHRTTRDRLIPSCLYTDPPVAHIGLSENDAKARGIAVKVIKIPTAAVLRSRTLDEMKGFLKALLDPATDRILGFTMIGPEAGEVMAVVQTAMMMDAPFTLLRDAVFAHPTMAEGLNVLFGGAKPAVK
jgi:pyruvate/2-oxoglutarate dehydrogenase complex dihydrolipoamide dehydrogenase (E3) component